MTPYIFILLFMILLRLVFFNKWEMNYKEKKLFLVFALTPITLLAGLRGETVGADTQNYKFFYDNLKESSYDDRIELGYVYLTKLFSSLNLDFQFLLLFVSLIFSLSVGHFILKNAKDPFLALLFFVTLGLFTFSLSGVRQTLAISVTLFSFNFIKDKKIYWFMFLIFIAFLFHKSAILFMPSYFISQRVISIKNTLIYTLIFAVIFSISEFLLLKAAQFMDLNYGIEQTNNGYVFFIIILLITTVGFKKRKQILVNNLDFKVINKANIVVFNLNFISLLLWAIRLVSRTAERVSFYFLPYTYLLLEEYISSIHNKSKRLFVYIVVSSLSIGLFLYRLSNNDTINPYVFI